MYIDGHGFCGRCGAFGHVEDLDAHVCDPSDVVSKGALRRVIREDPGTPGGVITGDNGRRYRVRVDANGNTHATEVVL